MVRVVDRRKKRRRRGTRGNVRGHEGTDDGLMRCVIKRKRGR